MVIKRGENVSLTRLGIDSSIPLIVGLGWHVKDSSVLDINTSAFLISNSGKVRHAEDFIYYSQTNDTDQSIQLQLEPTNQNDIRAFQVALSKVPTDIKKIVFAITIDEAESRQQNFGMVDSAYIRVSKAQDLNDELVRYNLENASEEASLMLGELYRHKEEWKFRAVSQGFNGGLEILAQELGVDLSKLKEEDTEDKASPGKNKKLKRKRRSPRQILLENSVHLRHGFNAACTQIHSAVEQKLNESNTRMILDRLFIDVFGYKIDEVKAEQKIQGRRADYVLAVDQEDLLVVEVKKAGMALRQQQIFQATSYTLAFAGLY